MSGDLIDTTEMYLKTVFELREAGVVPMRARIAERLGHSGPTVSQTVARMERDGLLHLDDQRRIRLTERGAELAVDVMRRHRLAERHLLDVIGLEYAQVHEEACRWEHVMSLAVQQRLAAALTPPYVDPYGNPIPGLQALGIEPAHDETGATNNGKDTLKSREVPPTLTAVLSADGSARVLLERIGERLQSETALLEDLAGHGIYPGVWIEVRRRGEMIGVTAADGRELTLELDAAEQLRVTPTTGE